MRLTKKQNGYTIMETLIVLAVTGVMFTSTVILLSGQMARYQFRESTLNSKQLVQDAINDTQTGFFDSINNASSVSTCSGGITTVPGDSNCVYLGKQISVNTSGVLTASPLYKFVNYPTDQYESIITLGVPHVNVLPSSATRQMPSGVTYPTATEFVVAFTNYPVTGDSEFVGGGGAQSTSVLVKSGANFSKSTVGAKLCMTNGNKKAQLIIGRNGDTNVEIEYGVCT